MSFALSLVVVIFFQNPGPEAQGVESPSPKIESQEPEAKGADKNNSSIEADLVPILSKAIERANGAIGSVRRADELMEELENRSRRGSLDPRIGVKVQGTVLRELHKSLEGAVNDSQKALEETRAEILPGLEAYVGKLEKELEHRDLSPEKQQSLLELLQDADEMSKKIGQQSDRLQARIGSLRSMKQEVWEMLDTYSHRLELHEKSGDYLDALKKLNEAIDSLRQRWEERFDIEA